MPRDREHERDREREASTVSMSSTLSSSSSSSSSASVRADGRGVLSYSSSNSRYGRHRARSQLGQPPDLMPPSFGYNASASMPIPSSNCGANASAGANSSSSSPQPSAPPPPPPPPPPYSSSYEPAGYSSSKPSILRTASTGSNATNRTHRSPSATASKAHGSHSRPRDPNCSIYSLGDDSDGFHHESCGNWVSESPPTSASSSSLPTSAHPNPASSSSSSSPLYVDSSQPPIIERSRSGSNASRHRYDASSATASTAAPPTIATAATGADTPRRRARKMLESVGTSNVIGGETKPVSSVSSAGVDGSGGAARARPVRIKYESTTRGIGGGKREISHASLGKLIARLTDAHQYDAEFRDVFLLTFRCFCSPYDFIKKLMKRYTAVLTLCGGLDPETLKETQELLDQITKDEENDRSSTSTSISTAKSDINTGMEANVSIMRLLSVIKFWIKESGFIEMDLFNDRRAQKKLLTLLQEIQNTTPISSIRQHAETLLLSVAQMIRQQNAPTSSPVGSANDNFLIPPPPSLTPSTSLSSVSSDHSSDVNLSRSQAPPERSPDFAQSKLSSAMSKLKLTRSSSDSKKDRSMVKLKAKPQSSTDVLHVGSYNEDPSMTFRRGSPMVTAPKMLRGVTTGSTDNMFNSSSTHPLEDVIQDTIQRARLTASRSSSRTSYDNVQPLTGILAQELADQLTLIEAEGFFARINRRELTNKAWTRETKHKEAPHVMAVIELFDATAEWVSSEILHPQLQAAERARLIMLFIDAADHCYQMNNFNSLFELTTGLSAPCIRQLNTTWGLVSAASHEKYQVLMQVCSPEDNYRNYRQAFALTEGQPRLPCSFILVKDLFTIEEAMKSIEDGLVNWQKFRKIYKAISEALERQNMNYLPPDGSSAAGISRKGKGALRHDRKVQLHIRHRLDTIRKDSSVLYQLARNANTQESIMFVNSLSEAGFL